LKGFREYFTGPVYLDTSLSFYRTLTGGKLKRHSVIPEISLNWKVWMALVNSGKKGITWGSQDGDSSLW
jgi:hypothetical protein